METINATGKPCPIPVIEAKKALRSCAAGDTVRILVDNDIARQNLEKMAKGMHSAFSFEKQGDGNILIILRAQEGAPGRKEERSGLVLAIGKNTMGTGNEELGAILIKSFVYSLTELDPPPEMILFFNSGIKLSTEGSAAVKDLKSLEEKGCIISSCGTCLDFYNLRDKLAVGNVTNMYAIAEAMAQAGKLINI
ncbi:MAG: sulfurtransferase-like selenium metabolism protein YedF [Treponema sp.]|jgi:selenium metabolism protein YedF|nr:sulfurtransferase-like selenium metabolism protein YedF [Treponema sp.]